MGSGEWGVGRVLNQELALTQNSKLKTQNSSPITKPGSLTRLSAILQSYNGSAMSMNLG